MFDKVFRSISQTEPKINSARLDNPTNPNNSNQLKNKQLLPYEISSKILDLEMQCENQAISKQSVFELLAEYTKAIQFYEEKENDKYKLYQKRMHKFLARPMIQEILRGKSGQMVIKKQQKIKTIRHAENQAGEEAKKIMQKHQEKQKKQEQIIQSEIGKQEQVLEQRIRRKRIMSNRSVKSSRGFECKQKRQNKNEDDPFLEVMDMKLLLKSIEDKKTTNKKVYV